MIRIKITARWAAIVLSLAAGTASAADWPQWRGPTRDGISKETGLLKQWPAAGPKLLWRIDNVGAGYSTPSIAGDRLYLITNEGMDDESVRAFATADGKPVWSTHIGKVGNPNQQPNYPAARSTPTVDGDKLYALGSDGDLARIDAATGKIEWAKSLRKDFDGQPGTWAYSESPLIDGDAIVCTPGGKTATIVALNKNTGEVIWKSAVPGGDAAGYASIVVGDAGGVKQYVQFLAKGVVGVDAKTGKFLWRYAETGKGPGNIPTPVVFGDYVYSGANMTGGGLAKIEGNADKMDAKQVYFAKKLPTAIGGAVKVGDYLYGAASQALMCVEFKTGQVKWSERGVGAGSVLYADGLLFVHGESGETALVEAMPEGYREKGRFTPNNPPDRGQSKAWAYPALANGRLYLRDAGAVWCYDVRDPSTVQ